MNKKLFRCVTVQWVAASNEKVAKTLAAYNVVLSADDFKAYLVTHVSALPLDIRDEPAYGGDGKTCKEIVSAYQ